MERRVPARDRPGGDRLDPARAVVYFLDLERRLADPADWGAVRLRFVGALTAAWGLDSRYPVGLLRHELLSIPQRRALHLLDELHRHRDPVTDWTAFREALWARRHELRDDLAP